MYNVNKYYIYMYIYIYKFLKDIFIYFVKTLFFLHLFFYSNVFAFPKVLRYYSIRYLCSNILCYICLVHSIFKDK